MPGMAMHTLAQLLKRHEMNSTLTNDVAALRIDGNRLWDTHMELARIGGTPKGGVCRLALTDLDRQARDVFVKWAEDAGCSVRVDEIGNIFVRRSGQDDSLPPVMTGSHLDTQPTGGKFDGIYGVLAGLEVMRTLQDNDIKTAAPLEVVVWTNEEGSRFVPVMMGSGVYVGAFGLEETLAQKDRDGVSVGEALRQIGYAGSEPAQFSKARAYFEAHIEQGPVLESNDKVIGVVSGALGQRWYDVTITGQESHAGTTPMERRKDALLAAADLIHFVNKQASELTPHGRGTVGCLDVYPSSRNVIPGQTKLTIDFRAATLEDLAKFNDALRQYCNDIQAQRQVGIDLRQVVEIAPQPFADEPIAAIRRQAERLGLSAMDVVSGAGHDAVYMARVAPTGMIFVPCKDGISHNELEDAQPGHLEAGCNVLLHAMLEQAGLVSE